MSVIHCWKCGTLHIPGPCSGEATEVPNYDMRTVRRVFTQDAEAPPVADFEANSLRYSATVNGMPWCDVCQCYHATRTAVCQPPVRAAVHALNAPQVVGFTPRAVTNLDAPDPRVIRYLEEMLDLARKGEIRAVATAVIWRANGAGGGWSENDDPVRLKGEIAQLLHDFCQQASEARSE